MLGNVPKTDPPNTDIVYPKMGFRSVVSDALPVFAGRCRHRESRLHEIKRNLNISKVVDDHDAVGLFQNITNATLIVLVNDSTMSCLLIKFCVTYVCTCHRLLNSQWIFCHD